MTREEIELTVKSYIAQAQSGLEIENPKIDFKTKWYNLTQKPEISEFLKDTSAIANTFGPDGYIVIGFDSKSNQFCESRFIDSRIGDTSRVTDIINKNVDRLFELSIYDFNLDGKSISVIHIPPSFDKPHIIKNYTTYHADGNLKKEEQHRTFVRKGTKTFPATKFDFELMYYDRKNLQPEFDITCSLHLENLKFYMPPTGVETESINSQNAVRINVPLIIENLGRRPVAIAEIDVSLSPCEEPIYTNLLDLKSTNQLTLNNITVQPNQLVSCSVILVQQNKFDLTFSQTKQLVRTLEATKESIRADSAKLKISTGGVISAKFLVVH